MWHKVCESGPRYLHQAAAQLIVSANNCATAKLVTYLIVLNCKSLEKKWKLEEN